MDLFLFLFPVAENSGVILYTVVFWLAVAFS